MINKPTKCMRCRKPWIECPRCYAHGMLAAFETMIVLAPRGFDEVRFIAALALSLESKSAAHTLIDKQEASK